MHLSYIHWHVYCIYCQMWNPRLTAVQKSAHLHTLSGVMCTYRSSNRLKQTSLVTLA